MTSPESIRWLDRLVRGDDMPTRIDTARPTGEQLEAEQTTTEAEPEPTMPAGAAPLEGHTPARPPAETDRAAFVQALIDRSNR